MHKKSYFFQSFLFVALFFTTFNSLDAQCDTSFDAVEFSLIDTIVTEGSTFCIDVEVRNFQNIIFFQTPITFNPNILRLITCEIDIDNEYDHPDIDDNFVCDRRFPLNPDGTVRDIPADELAVLNGQIEAGLFIYSSPFFDDFTIPDGDVFVTLCFEVIGSIGDQTRISVSEIPPVAGVASLPIEIFNNTIGGTQVCAEPSTGGNIIVGCLDASISIPATCPSSPGQSNGSISFSACGGALPYFYSLDGGAEMQIDQDLEEVVISNLSAGSYMLTVRDNSGLTIFVDNPIVVGTSDPVIINNVNFLGPTCPDARPDGFIEVDAMGGSGNYEYRWSVNELSLNPLTEISAGEYSVTVTDENGCKAIRENIIVPNNIMEVSNLNVTPASCADSPNGSVTFDVIGGKPETRTDGTVRYSVSLDGNRSFRASLPLTFQGSDRLDLSPGDHTIRVTDFSVPSDACFIDIPFTIVASKDFVVETNGANSGCSSGGTVSVNARREPSSDAASNDLTFRLLDENLVEIEVLNTSQTSFEFTGLTEGNYTVEMIDNADGCTFISDPNELAIVPPPADGLDIDFNIVQPLACGEDAIIEITGLGPDIDDLVFEWNTGTTITGDNTIMVGVEDNYNVTVTDPTGCSGNFDGRLIEIRNESVNLDFNNPNSPFGIDTIVNSLSCFGDPGSIEIDIQDPIVRSMASYTWFQDGTQIIGENSMSLNNLTPGNYSVEVSGTNICTVTEDFTINPGMAMEIVVRQQQTVCAGDPVDFTIDFENSSGNVNFTIQNIETQEFLPENQIQNGVPPGTYQIEAEDFQGCPASLTYVVDAFEEIVIPQLNVTNNDCFGLSTGTASFNLAALTGGNGTDKFIVWSTDPDNPTTDIANISDLSNGTYSVLVFDDECTSEEIFFDVTSPEELKIDDLNTVINQATCFGDSDGGGEIVISGGSGIADGFRLRDLETDELFPFATNTITGLPEGNYQVQIADDTGCGGIDTIMITQPDSLITMVDSAMVINLSCNADNIGIIRTINTGGNEGAINYTWSHDPTLNSPVATNLGEGIFTLTVEDSRGCTDMTEFEMMSPQMITLSNFDTVQFVQCFGDRLLFGGLEPSGGTNSGFRYSINNGNLMPISDSIFLSAGSYDLEIRDQDGCPLDTVFVISEPNEVVVELGPDVEINLGDSHQLRAEHDPAEQIVLYEWDPLEPDESPEGQIYEVTPLDDTVYGVRIENSAGCSDEDEVMVRVRRDRNIYIPNIINTGRNDANASFSIFAGQGVERIEFFQIFDRWGNKVHEVEQVVGNPLGSAVWDARLNGTLVEPGVYVYIARVLFTDGEALDYKGDVTVVR